MGRIDDTDDPSLDPVLSINPYPDYKEPVMRVGTKVRVSLIQSADSRDKRASRGLAVPESYEGDLVLPLEVGNSIWVDNSLHSTPIEMIDPVPGRAGVFLVKTKNSLYEVSQLPHRD